MAGRVGAPGRKGGGASFQWASLCENQVLVRVVRWAGVRAPPGDSSMGGSRACGTGVQRRTGRQEPWFSLAAVCVAGALEMVKIPSAAEQMRELSGVDEWEHAAQVWVC